MVQCPSLAGSCLVFPIPLMEETLFYSTINYWLHCHKLINHINMGLLLCSLFCFIGLCVCFYASTV